VFMQVLGGKRLGTNLFLFRRSVMDACGMFDERLTVLEDYDLLVRVAHKFHLGYVNQVLCHVHHHEGSLGTGTAASRCYYCRWLLNRKFRRLYPEETAQLGRIWKKLEADTYSNLVKLLLDRGCSRRARIFLWASLDVWPWQPRMVGVIWRIVSGGA